VNAPTDGVRTDHSIFTGVSTDGYTGCSVDVTNGYLFFTKQGAHSIAALKLSDSSVTEFIDTTAEAAGSIGPVAIHVSGSHVYWTSFSGNVYDTALTYSGGPVNGTTTKLLTADVANPLVSVVGNGSNVYVLVSAATGTGGIYTVGGGVLTKASTGTGINEINNAFGLRVDGSNFYFFDGSGNIRTADTTTPTTVSPVVTPFGTQLGGITSVADSTVVTLSSFTATPAANKINLAWVTGSEVNTAGFNVLRATALAGPYTKLNSALIAATGTGVAGAAYTFADTAVITGQTFYYKLEDLDTKGVSTLHGPVSATAGASLIASFQASPVSVFLGGGSLLSWTTNGAADLFLNGATVTGNSLWVAPAATTSYALTTAGAASLVTVNVKAFTLQDMAGLAKAWGHAKGEAAFDPSYDLNGDGKVDDADVTLLFKGL
jgi:hypothetical protein